MCKSEVFNRVLNVVSREMEIDVDEIIGKGRTIEVVDARCMLFKLLHEEGLYPSQIAEKAHRTSASVRYLLSDFNTRVASNVILEKTLKKS